MVLKYYGLSSVGQELFDPFKGIHITLCISQLIQHSRVCGFYHDFHDKGLLLQTDTELLKHASVPRG